MVLDTYNDLYFPYLFTVPMSLQFYIVEYIKINPQIQTHSFTMVNDDT